MAKVTRTNLLVFPLFVLYGYSLSQNPIPLGCPAGWTLYGSQCYRVYTERLNWGDAGNVCLNNGARLVRIFGYEENAEVAEMAETAGVSDYWIGMNRLGLDDWTRANNESADWHGARQGSPPASLIEGYWRGSEPEVSRGACVHVGPITDEIYGVSWRMADCVHPRGFVCQAPAGKQGQFRCANGRYITHAQCDGEDDCGDNSDESNCTSGPMCRHLLTGTGGTGVTSGTPYPSNAGCQWTIQAPVGKRVSLVFTAFDTEDMHDMVTILIGGKTLSTSTIEARLSGRLNAEQLPRYFSTNNLMIIQFMSDSSVQRDGFRFDWTADDQFPGGEANLTSLDTPTEIRSLRYGTVLANVRHKWVIEAPIQRRVISVQITELDLPDCAYINIYNKYPGYRFTKLVTIRASDNPQSVISTYHHIQIYYHTCEEHYPQHRGFILTFQTGCHGAITADSGHVISPGYMAGLDYPDFQTCTWRVSSESGAPLNLAFRDPMGLEEGVDTLQIFAGMNDSAPSLGNFSGSLLPTSTGLVSPSGLLYMEFTSSSIVSARGFRIDFSVPCPRPTFNPQNRVVPANFGTTLDSQIHITCTSGYEFAQEEHLDAIEVVMVCALGGWNVRQTPQCEPVWCDQAPVVQNAFYARSTGARRDDTVTYSCYDGFTMAGSETVTCNAAGVWSTAPACSVSSCPSLTGLFDNGVRRYRLGTTLDFGSVLEYTCNSGYTLDGPASIICTEVGWSDPEPTCVILQCPLALLEHRLSEHGNATPNANPVVVNTTVSIQCDPGFRLDIASASTVVCQNNQTFSAMPVCEDINECDAEPCSGNCENTEGSFQCSCDDGFELNVDGSSCNDIRECDGDSHGCNHNCIEEEGGYHCECLPDGYVLYTANGTAGFNLPEGETGLLPGDVYRINHTCVRMQCPALPALTNGKILNQQSHYNLGDSVLLFCNIGYVINGVNGQDTQGLRCMRTGQWDQNPSNFSCLAATCEQPDTSSLDHPPVFQTVGPYAYKLAVFITCSYVRPIPTIFARRCTRDTDGFYKLFKQGESMECPIVDCGDPNPSLPSGAEINGSFGDTFWRSNFSVRCADLYTQEGSTTLGNNRVTCANDGKWDYGTFQCNGAGCTDPGTLAGTSQQPEGYYAPSDLVRYNCTQAGFTLSDERPLMCQIVAGTPKWNGTAPNCSDTTAPVISQTANLCNSTMTILALQAPNFSLPTAMDNTGATEIDGLTFSLTVDNNDPTIALTEDKVFSYEVTDEEGNSASCEITIDVIGNDGSADVVPTITCPESFSHVVGSTASNVTVEDLANVPTSSLDVTYTPTTFSSSIARIGQLEIITATVTDSVGRSASCKYMILLVARPCSPQQLKDPKNGVTTCSSTTTGYSCTASCNPGFYMYQPSNGVTLVSTQTYTCTTGSGFPVTTVPDCVASMRADYYFRFELEYNGTTGANTPDCLNYYKGRIQDQITRINGTASRLASQCAFEIRNTQTRDVNVLVTLSTSSEDFTIMFDPATSRVKSNITMSLRPATLNDDIVDSLCLVFFKLYFSAWSPTISDLRVLPASTSCPMVSSQTGYVESVDLSPESGLTGEYRCSVAGTKQIDITNNHVCLPCPFGHYYDRAIDQCLSCPIGQYQPNSGSSSCMNCTAGTSTYNNGSNDETLCIARCNTGALAGFVSDLSLPPCTQCGINTYSANSRQCTSCPPDTATAGTGSSNLSQCRAKCLRGQYSLTGYMPCTPCPHHFYQDVVGATTCIECAMSQYTASTGSQAATDCQSGQDLCTNSNPCRNGGTCTFGNHHAFCQCTAGYTGPLCATPIDYCASNPCYHGFLCQTVVNGYTCACGSGFTGVRCENDPNNCATNPCQNGGQCLDLLNSNRCLCPIGFTGTRCTETEDICIATPCLNGGTCTPLTSQRRHCACRTGYSGDDCGINLDNCASYPCTFGFRCVDMPGTYRCECPAGFGDRDCIERPNVCPATNICGASGVCVDDYNTNSVICDCNTGYDDVSASRDGHWLQETAGLSVNTSCIAFDHCRSNPCHNGATCTSTTSGEECACPEGYGGSRCQHNIDHCSGDPCGDFGECIDGLSGYQCGCDPGYTGDHCETDINECETPSYPCVAVGTDTSQDQSGCEDLLADFRCYCLAGFTGQDCWENINDCLSNPCQHGAQCLDEVNSYTCDCSDGWIGEHCDVLEEYCDPSPCENGGDCINVFGNYSCICEYPYYGSRCESEADTCSDASPCVDPNAQCFTDENGLASCLCSSAYAGNGCHVAVDACANPGFCGVGGRCTASLDSFECECGADFSGERCEVSEDDCAGVSCPGGATCIDSLDDHFCMCPVGMQGPNCDKQTNADFDLFFYDKARTGAAYQPFAFPLGRNNVTEISVGMWVRYSTPGAEGTFFTLYGLETEILTGPRRALLRYDHERIQLSFTPSSIEQVPFGVYDINDGEWYYIMLTWNSVTGQLRIRVNSVLLPTINGYARRDMLPPYGVILLGTQWNEQQMGIMNSGFHGYVSHMYMWKRVLATSPDITDMSDDRNNLVQRPSLVVDWGYYVLERGVKVSRPSRAGDDVCPPGFTGSTCSTRLPDKTPPRVLTCPNDVYVNSSVRVTQVLWSAPTFEGYAGQVASVYSSGSVFVWGRYPNWYMATDANGNSAICSFNVFVRNQNCPSPGDPLNGVEDCSSETVANGQYWPFRTCRASCNANFSFSVPTPDMFTCGPQGAFNVKNIFLGFRYPACGPTSVARSTVTVSFVYRSVPACDDIQVVDGFAILIYERLDALNLLWLDRSTRQGGLCGSQICEDFVTVEIECGSAAPAGRRRRQTTDANVVITIPNVQDPLMNRYDVSVERTAADVLTQYILDNDWFNFSNKIVNTIPDETALSVTSIAVCGAGMILQGGACVQCAAGTRYVALDGGQCEPCPLGTYQPNPGSNTCLACGAGFSTELTGSTNQDQCSGTTCVAGTYYVSARGVCEPCLIGFYQSEMNQFFCWPCDADKTTAQAGSDSEADCFEVCPSGTELIANGNCQPCQAGTYRTQGVDVDCVNCPMGRTTPGVGSQTAAACSVYECFAGTYYNNDTDSCQNCTIGSYQSQDYQTQCIACGPLQTTLAVGSASLADCLFFCPAGQEDINRVRVCTPCAVGFYKDNAIPRELCDACPTGFVTPSTGSNSTSDCSVLACKAGTQPNASRNGCEPCPRGTFQSDPYQDACIACSGVITIRVTSTMETGSTSQDQCQEFCPSGESDVSGACEPCAIGYYKNNDNNEFGPCLLCPDPDFVTASTGSANVTACDVRNCSAGTYRDTSTNTCVGCPVGQYQNETWQTSCEMCPTQTTTDNAGADSLDDCRLECTPGFEDERGQPEECVPCDRGYYKDVTGVRACTACGNGFITATAGATSPDQCSMGDCRAGQYLNPDDNTRCLPCAIGSYTNRQWQTSCTTCGNGTTTLQQGTDSETLCVTNCASGNEYSLTSRTCVPCQRGFYRTQNINVVCERCPVEFVTNFTGAFNAGQCTFRNCSAGSFYDQAGTGLCKSCPLGEYQSQKWAISCVSCGQGNTTFQTGSTARTQCILDCGPGSVYNTVTKFCEGCQRGYYKNATDATCRQCPAGYTTETTGADSAADCTVPFCGAGSYISNTDCLPCALGYYQDQAGQYSCIACHNDLTRYTTLNVGRTSLADCQSTNECTTNTHNCLDAASGGQCVDQSGWGFWCRCREGYTGDGLMNGTGCTRYTPTDICDTEDYCQNDGVCISSGSNARCDCTSNYEGERCETRKEPSNNDRDVLIGAAVGGGVGGLALILLITALCYYCFQKDNIGGRTGPVKMAPQQQQFAMVPSILAYDNTMASGIITRPAIRYAGSTLNASTMFNNDGASIAGFPNVGGQKYLIYDEQDDTPIMQNGYSNSNYDPNYEERGSSVNFT